MKCDRCKQKIPDTANTCVFYHSIEMWFCRSCYRKWITYHKAICKQFKKEPYEFLEQIAVIFAKQGAK